MTSDATFRLDDFAAAVRRIEGLVVQTPLVDAPGLAADVDDGAARVMLKLETVQPTGAFKVRGAASCITALDPITARRGVVTASTGNHGRAVAHVAAELGVPAAVCLSELVPAGKIASLESLGCELVIGGASQTVALEAADRLVAERGMTLVHPFDDPRVIAGQGTIGLEVVDQCQDLTRVLVPLSGGGLAAGIGAAVKALRPATRIVGVSMEHGATMAASLREGRPVELDEVPTLADSLQGGIGLGNRHTFRLVRDLVDEVVLIDEDTIWQGMRFALEQHRLVLEGGAAVGIGALLSGAVEACAGTTVVICSGANAEPAHIAALVSGSPRPTA